MRWPPRFCPDCGAPLPAPVPTQPHFVACAACDGRHWRNAKPCAGVLVVRDGRVLLGRRAAAPRAGLWDVIGGFLEPDEDPASGALREAREETGLALRLKRLVGMFPDTYGDDGTYTLNIYFEAEPLAGEPVAASDVTELRWFAPDQLPDEMAFPHELDLLARWREMAGDGTG
jgi:ADP-ribose pyrophosphatase YjhB (NUDIX family)